MGFANVKATPRHQNIMGEHTKHAPPINCATNPIAPPSRVVIWYHLVCKRATDIGQTNHDRSEESLDSNTTVVTEVKAVWPDRKIHCRFDPRVDGSTSVSTGPQPGPRTLRQGGGNGAESMVYNQSSAPTHQSSTGRNAGLNDTCVTSIPAERMGLDAESEPNESPEIAHRAVPQQRVSEAEQSEALEHFVLDRNTYTIHPE